MTKQYKEHLKAWKERAFSWSQISSFEYDPEQWYKKYFLKDGEEYETEEMKFGKTVGEQLATNPKFLPQVPRLTTFEKPFNVKFGKIMLKGFADGFCEITRRKFDEYKTGVKPWDQKRADEHGQIDMYLFMHYLDEKIRPEECECRLIWLPTVRKEDGDFKVEIKLVEPVVPQVFRTKRTMQDLMVFGARINSVNKEMQIYAELKEKGIMVKNPRYIRA